MKKIWKKIPLIIKIAALPPIIGIPLFLLVGILG